jgi:hypothetical protein
MSDLRQPGNPFAFGTLIDEFRRFRVTNQLLVLPIVRDGSRGD